MSTQPLLHTLDAVLFDLDGTLLDTAPDLANALFTVCANQNVTPPEYSLIAQHVSTGAIGLTRLAFPEHPEEIQQSLCQQLVEIYSAHICEQTRPYPGITEMLSRLEDETISWGVVTNKLERLALPILEKLNLLTNCRVVVGGDTAARNKPHPDPINYALDKLGLAAESVAYVGDHRKDVQSGQAAGTLTVACSWGYIISNEDPNSWGADYTIDHPEELLTLLLTHDNPIND
ncbi:MAG: HAD-IA family hydrolase [Gammaproteobacteria bacterium]|nr:HAD-IA family hydrolase [Gammaproteobacteria bacterium]MCP4090862.1 HAD-IA family hydrolase [Gammaproteobacteria bacterium]MCP4275530.1 HAD-IA family hydrolase [Gammaproteobacteria bacterium]MCP4832252.1 HAD-IA family hydrolase [Gammaproteobacteria bacterium]MCP4930306.1 HAD-IA family hydrolase [Gammaproteobacteria bacterium]